MSSRRRSAASRIRTAWATSVPELLLVRLLRSALLRLLHGGVDLLLHLLHGLLTLLQLLLLDGSSGGGGSGGFDAAGGERCCGDDDEKCFHGGDSTPMGKPCA